MARPGPSHQQNHLLAALPLDDLELLAPHLVLEPLILRQIFEQPNRPFKRVYFITSGFASVVARVSHDKKNEVGLIGREGMSGLAAVLGGDRWSHETYVQAPGHAWSIGIAELQAAMVASWTMRAVFLKFVQGFMTQTAHTAIANSRGSVEERLARWLLMAHDRCKGDVLSLTHEFLSLMLGVRRAGVTVALHALEARGLVETARGTVRILNRKALQELAGPYYGTPEAELKRLLATSVSR
jgi:CRP-like cAMP-binding protein